MSSYLSCMLLKISESHFFCRIGGYPPFNETKKAPIALQIKKGDYDFPKDWWGHVSCEAIDLIKHLLVVDPAKRLDQFINCDIGKAQ